MILGIDPGLANLGWAVVDTVDGNEYQLIECGCVTSKKTEDAGRRLNGIYKELEKIIKKHKVKVMAIETLFFAKNVRSAMQVAEVIGVIKVCGEKNKLKVNGYTPLQVKMSLVGYGRADKEQVETMVRTLLGLEEEISPSHASDAVAVALTHGFTSQELKV
jgi:crossover junction endodeoxyribonuclease RuvC